MPVYEYECSKCSHNENMVHSMAECDDAHKCPKCRHLMHRNIFTPRAFKSAVDETWEYENDGRGREATQFVGKFKPGDPRNKRYFRSQNEMIEAAKREGYDVQKIR